MDQVYRALIALLDAGGFGALCTVVTRSGSAPQQPGSKMLVRSDGTVEGTVGGGAIEEAVRREAQAVLQEGRARVFAAHLSRDLAMCCGGKMEIFIEPIGLPPWLLLFGGGHVGRAVCEAASIAGFRVHVIDAREEHCSVVAHPRAEARTCDEPLAALSSLPFHDDTYVVITTHDHRLDEELLHRCIERPHRYLGMIGSRAKVHRFLERALHRGQDLQKLGSIRAPIGLDLGGREPGEIAISIVAELVAVRRRGRTDAVPSLSIAAVASERLPAGTEDPTAPGRGLP
jgi:xanthine dehydrogenase accessory factor